MKPKQLAIMAVAAVVIVGLFLALRPKAQNNKIQDQITQSSPAESPALNVFDLVISNKKLTSGPEVIKVNQSEEVTINITSDEEEEFHLHGYDKSVDLKPNEKAQLIFTAELSGRFPYELENSKTEIGALEVQPK